MFNEEKKVYEKSFLKETHVLNVYKRKYLTPFSKCNFKQPPLFINYDNPHNPYDNLLGDHKYGIRFYQRLKKYFQILSVLNFKSKETFFLLTMRWIFSRSKKLTRTNSFILPLKVLDAKF